MLPGCSMVESIPIGVTDYREGLACRSQAGAYYLPKTVLAVKVLTQRKETGDDKIFPETNPAPVYTIKLDRRILPDPRFGFCLDYLASSTANDTVDVRKLVNSHLLAIVATDAVDQSRYILQTLIRSIFIVASGDPQFPAFANRSFATATGAQVEVFRGEFDPFDPERTALINEQLKAYGFCLTLGPYTVNAAAREIDRYCEHPKAALRKLGALRPKYQKARIPEHEGDRAEADRRRWFRRADYERSGIYYRPRIPYQLDLYLKTNLKVEGNWRLRLRKQVPMENISPLILANVDRTFFAERKSTLVFSAGMLERVCVYKGSELLQASYIPLQIVQSVVQLPTSIFQVRIDQTAHEAELAAVQREVIKWQIRLLEARREIAQGAVDPSLIEPVDVKDSFADALPIPATTVTGYTQLAPFDPTKAATNYDQSVADGWTSICPSPARENPDPTGVTNASVLNPLFAPPVAPATMGPKP
jgi:hypothetical protein